MTSNTTPSGVCSASSTYATPGYEAWRAFNGIIDAAENKCWIASSGQTTGWLQYQFVTVQAVQWYSITNRTIIDVGASPKDWTLEGSNDGLIWTILDTQTNQTWINGEKKEYTIVNPRAFLYYRLNISANNTS